MTDVEKLIEELGRMMSMNYNSAARVRDDAVNAINRLSNRLALAEKVAEASRALLFDVRAYEAWERPCHAVTNLESALTAFDAAKEPQ